MRRWWMFFPVVLGLPSMGHAQLGPTELLPEWGQAGWSNPAMMHPSGSHILLGGLSGFQMEVDHTGPVYADFISSEGFVDPSLMLERMDPVESISARSEVPIISLGFRDKQRFEFRLRSRLVVEEQLDYDRDLFDLAWKGNGHPDNIGRPISMSDFGVNAQAYFDHGISVGAMAQEDKLWLGWGIHLLNGIAAVQTEEFEAIWTTDTLDYSWDLTGGAALNTAGLDLDSLIEGGELEPPGNGGIPPTLGAGVAFDYGLLWRPTPWFDIEAAVEGRGGMRWLESLSRKQVDTETFVLQGLDLVREWGELDSLPQDSIPDAFDSWLEGMQDSLVQTFPVVDFPGPSGAFDTRVRETWRLGFRMRPLKGLELSVLGYRQFRFGRVQSGGLFGVTGRLRGNITAHVQGQYHADRWLWGAGLSLRGGPMRLSVSARHVPGLILPLESAHWQGQAGLSIDVGYRQKKPGRKKNDLGNGKGMWH